MPPTLFQKLFNKKHGLTSPARDARDDCVFSWPLPEFDPSQIRLIVYQDCERRGRNVLFDSSAKRKIEDVSVSDLLSAQAGVHKRKCYLQGLAFVLGVGAQPEGSPSFVNTPSPLLSAASPMLPVSILNASSFHAS